MGYFSNSTDGMAYESQYCEKCYHDRDPDNGCVVLLAHLLYNYDDCDKEDSILHLLIPTLKKPPWNEKCKMFIDIDIVDCDKNHLDQLQLIEGIK